MRSLRHRLWGTLALPGLVFIASASASDLQGLWGSHPALESFSLNEDELPGELYLVRTRGFLPETEGVRVHGSRGGVFIVSGDETTVMGLVERGCGVFPLYPLDEPDINQEPDSRIWTAVSSPDPVIEDMVAQVSWAGISSDIQWLVDFGTRYSFASNHYEVTGSLADRFAGYGLSPVLRSFDLNGSTLWNVEATQTGTVYPDSFIIVCGHFDSVSGDPYVSAPGADDNGTGTATVLAAAEILTQYSFEYSIRYICFSGEEQGLKGSQAYASWAAENDLGIVGVLNFDMLGYWEPGVEQDLEIETDEPSQWFAQAILNAADLYTDTPYELHVYGGAWWGDHASFWAEGFTAVNHEEAWDWGDPDFNPYYHSTSDQLEYIGEEFMVENIQLCVAALATLAGYDPGSSGTGSGSSAEISSAALHGHPNPFSLQMEFTVSGCTSMNAAEIVIYDVMGREVDVLSISLSGGQGSALWTPGTALQNRGSAGVFFARIAGSTTADVLRLLRLE